MVAARPRRRPAARRSSRRTPRSPRSTTAGRRTRRWNDHDAGPVDSARASSACTLAPGASAARSRVAVVDQHVLLDARRRAGSRPGRSSARRPRRKSSSRQSVGGRAGRCSGHRRAQRGAVALDRRPLREAVKKPISLRASDAATRSGSARSPGQAGPERGHRRPRAQRPRRRAGEHRRARSSRPIAELDRQQTQVRLGGRTFMSTSSCRRRRGSPPPSGPPWRPSCPRLRPAVVRSRFHFRETGPGRPSWSRSSDRIAARGSHGVMLKAPDVPEVAAAVQRLGRGRHPGRHAGDRPARQRPAGLRRDRQPGGRRHRRLPGRAVARRPARRRAGHASSSGSFRGEEEREMGFRAAHARPRAEPALVEVTDTDGLDATHARPGPRGARRAPRHRARSTRSGGGNAASVDAFDALGRQCRVFVAHDLDDDNTALLRDRPDLRGAAPRPAAGHAARLPRRSCRRSGALPGGILSWPSSIQVVTPFNAPQPPPPEHR